MNDPKLLDLEENIELFITNYVDIMKGLKKNPSSQRLTDEMKQHLRSFNNTVYFPYRNVLSKNRRLRDIEKKNGEIK